MCKFKDQGHIFDPVSNECTLFMFCTNRIDHSWDMTTGVFDLEKSSAKNKTIFLQDLDN